MGGQQGYLWPNVEDAVFEDLGRLHERTGPWDAILFTGDVAFSGAEAEFRQFEAIRKRLIARVGRLGSSPVFFAVPGNHDLVRPPEHGGVVRLARDWSDDAQLRQRFWGTENNDLRNGMDRALANWSAWWSTARPEGMRVYREGLLPGDFVATFATREALVGVIGLNTTFLQLEAGDLKGRLSLDARQLAALCPEGGGAWAREHDVAILMTHQPPDWLDAAGVAALRDEIAPPGRFAVHVYGHQHEARYLVAGVGGAQPRCEVLGCSLFGLETWGPGIRRLHGYVVAQVDGTANRSLRLWPRVGVHQQAGGWRIAPDYSHALRSDEGTEPVSLGPSLRAQANDSTSLPDENENTIPQPVRQRHTADERVDAPATESSAWHVFIAYPARERAAADGLYAALIREGAVVFLDHQALRPGDSWPAKIAAAQRDARVTAVLVSKNTERAFYQNEEITHAIALFRKDSERHRVVPVYLDDEADPPYGLRTIQGLVAGEAGGMSGVAARLLNLVGLGDQQAGQHASTLGGVRTRAVGPRRSPFRPGMPLYVSDFFPGASRRALLAVIQADVDAGTNVNLVGERRLGRTSLLNHVYGRLVAEAERVVARVNLQDGIANESDFYGAVLWGIGQSSLGADAIGPVRVGELEKTPVAAYTELRQVLRAIRRNTTATVLIDEFERCFELRDGFPLPTFFDNLRSLLGGDEQGPYATAVVATRQPMASYFIDRQVTSTLPGYLPVRRMELLIVADVDEVLAQDSPHRLGPAQRDHAARLADGHPCRLQCAGEAWYPHFPHCGSARSAGVCSGQGGVISSSSRTRRWV